MDSWQDLLVAICFFVLGEQIFCWMEDAPFTAVWSSVAQFTHNSKLCVACFMSKPQLKLVYANSLPLVSHSTIN